MSEAMDPERGNNKNAGHKDAEHGTQETRDGVSPTLLPPPREGGKRRRWGIWVVLVIVVLIGYAVWHATHRNAGGPGGIWPCRPASPYSFRWHFSCAVGPGADGAPGCCARQSPRAHTWCSDCRAAPPAAESSDSWQPDR